MEIKQTEKFSKWHSGLRDSRARVAVALRIDRLALGLLGDAKSVGGGVFELRIHYGPGYRLYFTRAGETVVLLLCGGDKSSQNADIAEAKRIAAT